MPREAPVTAVQSGYERRALPRQIAFYLFVAALVLGLIVLGFAVYGYLRFNIMYGRSHANQLTHFKYGSIGAELANGLPYKLLLALPKVFPEHFGDSHDLRQFGFIYEPDAPDPALPIGFARGVRQGVEVAWLNCAACHTGRVQLPGQSVPQVIVGMPANSVDLESFFKALFDMAVDKRFTWDGMKDKIGELNFIDRFLWEWLVIPNTRSTLIARRSELLPFLDPNQATQAGLKLANGDPTCKASLNVEAKRYRRCHDTTNLEPKKDYAPARPTDVTNWGPGRVDTFNPYKLIQFEVPADCLKSEERIGVSDFPSIFLQGPRGDRRMNLHWDGNNASLTDRNLSAALGAGVTEDTARYGFASIARVAEWLETLTPPESPYKKGLAPERVDRGKEIYMAGCATCHGYQDKTKYVFEGARLGQIEPIDYIGTDVHRLNSYTELMQKYQTDFLFCRSPQHRFRHFKKTNGYANFPLDALWLRAPYLHNGSVPTLADMLEKPENRPKSFVRGLLELDAAKGGFVAPPCIAGSQQPPLACFETMKGNDPKAGNSNGGHLYGTDLPPADKQDLLQYLLTF
jgi:mono/diheme cytochrome c family protein